MNLTLTQRNPALDAMRGFTLAAMVLVNTPGSREYVYRPLAHVEWEGYTLADLIFPFFLFMVGAAMFFSLRRYDYKPSWEALFKIARRVFIIFVIGIFLNAFPFMSQWSELRLMGVLQRIALAYGLVALAVLYLPVRALYELVIATLLGYWLLLYLAGGAEPYSLEGNVVGRVDRAVLGGAHLWQGKGIPFDPEGLLGTLPATVNVLVGYLAARVMVLVPSQARQLRYLLVAGVIMVFIGHVWDAWLPLNKSLWTSSFAVLSCGWALLTLALFVALSQNETAGRILQPLRIYGINPLFIFVLSMLWVRFYFLIPVVLDGETVNAYQYLYHLSLQLIPDPHAASLLFASLHMMLFWALAYGLYRKHIVIRI